MIWGIMRGDGGIYMSKRGQFLFSTVSDFLNGKLSRSEAAEVIDRYARLGGARESEIVSLREMLLQAERRQKRGG